MNDQETPAKENDTSTILRKIVTNPWFVIIVTAFGVLGTLFGIYSYFDSKAYRDLAYYVNPARAVVVQSGKSSNLLVSYKSEIIQNDITAVQIAIWNAGKLPIKKSEILKPVVLYTENNSPILEATIRNSQRDVSNLILDTSESQQGRVKINWDILEQNDGGVIQLIYAGDRNTKIGLDGIIEGQRAISLITDNGLSSPRFILFLIYLLLSSLIIGFSGGFFTAWMEDKFGWKKSFIRAVAISMMSAGVVNGTVVMVFYLTTPKVPFT